MSDPADVKNGNAPQPELTAERTDQIAANIERYLDNHTREGSHAWQMNMAARPGNWSPIEAAAQEFAPVGSNPV